MNITMIQENNVLSMDDTAISDNNSNSTWGIGNQIYVYAKNNSEFTNKGFPKSSNIFEVKWDNEMFSPIFCKLISQSKVIFFNIQLLVNEKTKPLIEIKNQLSNHSREYRSILKECAIEVQTQISTGIDDKESLGKQKDLLEMFEILWSLVELLFIDTNPNSYIMKLLLDWFSLRFFEYDELGKLIVQSQQGERHPNYWKCVKCLLLYGRVDDAKKMLSIHSSAASQLYQRLIKLLDLMPIYKLNQHSFSEFCIKWYQWHDLTQSHLQDAIFSADQNLEDICKIICGDENIYVQCKDYVQTWYGMFVSRLFYQKPMITSAELHSHAKYSLDQYSDFSEFDNIILAIFSLDAQKAIHLSSSYFNNWWFVGHITDLLTHLNVVPDEKLKFGSNLREFLLLEYTTSLLSHKSLWQYGIEYLSFCPVFGRDYISEFVLRINCDTEFKVRKILRICDLYELEEEGLIIKKEMAVNALKKNCLGNALVWSSKAKDVQLSNAIVERLFDEYIKNGRFENTDLLNNLGPHMHLSNHVAFLGKFCEYEQLCNEERFNDACNLLLLLLTEGNAPKKYWIMLFSKLITLFESNSISLENLQICNFMERLNKYQIWKSLNKIIDNNNDEEKIQALRIYLARNLTQCIVSKKLFTPTV